MFVRLHIQSPGFNLQTVLQADALPALVELVQKHRVTDMEALRNARRGPDGGGRPGGPGPRPHRAPESEGQSPAVAVPASLSAESTAVRERVSALQAEDFFAKLQAATFPEKLLAAAGWLEARSSDAVPPHRRDVKRLLVRLGNEPPANPGRDFRTAWNEGWIAETGERCLTVTNEGWAKIQAMSQAS